MYYVYLLKSKSYDQTYVGSTNDLRRRVTEHNQNKSVSTKRYGPWSLVYYEAYLVEKLARVRESRLKHNGNAIRELKKRVGFTQQHFSPKNDGVASPSTTFLRKKSGGDLPSTTFLRKKSGAGFTLVELLIVVAIFGLLAALGLFVSFQTYRTYDFQDEVTRVTTAFQTARSRSMANVDGVKHSVCYDTTSHSAYIISDTIPTCTDGQKVAVSEAVGVTWPNTITFNQLSGQANTTDITLTYEGKTATIQISSNGRVNWVWTP